MQPFMKRSILAVGVLLLLFGSRCLNYTKPSALDHHLAFAREKGLPEPSNSILFGGGFSMAVGGAMIGFGIVRRIKQA